MADYLNTDDTLLPYDESEEEAPEQEAEIIEDQIAEENIDTVIKLDYKLKTMEERAALVEQIVGATPEQQLTTRYLEILGDYIMGALSKEEKKDKTYLTSNRLITINKRETSLEGLAEKFENGEDGIYNLITNDKNILLSHKATITNDDVNNIPTLKSLRENIKEVENASKAASGKKKYLLKKQLIEMRRDQYVLKNIFSPNAVISSSAKGINKVDLSEHCWVDENGEPQSDGLVSFFYPHHINAILSNYHALKLEVKRRYNSDFYFLMEDFDKVMKKALYHHPELLDLVYMKTRGKTNVEITQMLKDKYNIVHTPEYISSLWRNKVPKLISEQAKKDFLMWYYTYERPGEVPFKKCSCCGQIKLAHTKFFSKNNTSKDSFYSICKDCRNMKTKEKKEMK